MVQDTGTHTAPHCNVVQDTGTHTGSTIRCNVVQDTGTHTDSTIHCNVVQDSGTHADSTIHCNVVQDSGTHADSTIRCNVVQDTCTHTDSTIHCNVVQNTSLGSAHFLPCAGEEQIPRSIKSKGDTDQKTRRYKIQVSPKLHSRENHRLIWKRNMLDQNCSSFDSLIGAPIYICCIIVAIETIMVREARRLLNPTTTSPTGRSFRRCMCMSRFRHCTKNTYINRT